MSAKNLNLESNEWYILKDEEKFGPYTYGEMLRLLQESLLQNFDFVWAPHLDAWTSVHELSEFSPDRVHRVFEKTQEDTNNAELFKRRVHERTQCEIPMYAHDNSQFWEGTVENLSEGGALVYMFNPLLLPGSVINIHIRQSAEADAGINLRAEVISKRLIRRKITHDTGLHYAVRFIDHGKWGLPQLKKSMEVLSKKQKDSSN